jgi:hypothetical protein
LHVFSLLDSPVDHQQVSYRIQCDLQLISLDYSCFFYLSVFWGE